MPQAMADPEELERFARNLRRFNEQLGEYMPHLQGQFANLGDVWRDQENMRFALEFQQTMRSLQNFMRVADAHIPFLLRGAQRVRDYLNQR